MAYDKRYVAQKRQRRRRKTAKAKMHLYEQGKLPHDKLPALAKKFLSRKTRALKRAGYRSFSAAKKKGVQMDAPFLRRSRQFAA